MSTRQPLTSAEVLQVAGLARLELSAEEVETFTAQLGSILAHADDIASLDLGGLEPMAHPFDIENVFRPDTVKPTLERDELLSQAPDVERNRFKVGRILGEAP
ncbi:MAG: Asp-tRNA(Asn)/Glu-tRNA(Gln) amidotransferase subunit GatC [Actinomycetota bacterium]